MEAFSNLSYSERLESLEKLEDGLTKLCNTNNEYAHPSSSSRSSITTFDVQSMHSIVKDFVSYSFSFPDYCEKVERVSLNKLLYSKSPGQHIFNNPNISLCSMVQNDDLKKYMKEFERKMSSIPKNESDDHIKSQNRITSNEEKSNVCKTRHLSENGSIYSVTNMSISSLSDINDIIVNNDLCELEKNEENGKSVSCQNTPTQNDDAVSSDVFSLAKVQNNISEHSVISDNAIISDKQLEKNTDINESEKISLSESEETTRKDGFRRVNNCESTSVKCIKDVTDKKKKSCDETGKQSATENALKSNKGTRSTSGEDSDVLVLNVNDTDNITEHSVTDDEKITPVSFNKNLPLKEKDNLKGKSFNKKHMIKWENDPSYSKKKKYTNDKNSFKQSSKTIQNSVDFNKNKPEITEKENKIKNVQSEIRKNYEKPKYTIEDPLEMNDINDPEWEQISCLKTDEERYRAVKNCWGSQKIPNPNRDLTRHCFRLRRLRKEGYTSTDNATIQRKRTATREPEGMLDNKRQKIETFPCTMILDRKIELEEKLHKQKIKEEESNYKTSVHKVNYTTEKDRKILHEEYLRKISRGHPSSVNVNNITTNADIQKWKDHRERCISAKKDKELELAHRRFENAKRRLDSSHAQTINKLNSAKQEVLKFNQFYCGLNNLDPTVIEGRRVEEARKAEQMYEFYQKIYAPSRM